MSGGTRAWAGPSGHAKHLHMAHFDGPLASASPGPTPDHHHPVRPRRSSCRNPRDDGNGSLPDLPRGRHPNGMAGLRNRRAAIRGLPSAAGTNPPEVGTAPGQQQEESDSHRDGLRQAARPERRRGRLSRPCAETRHGRLVEFGELLGHAAAHEIGHLLLGSTGHSPAGIMRASWEVKDLWHLPHSGLIFLPRQLSSIRTAMVRQISESGPDGTAEKQ